MSKENPCNSFLAAMCLREGEKKKKGEERSEFTSNAAVASPRTGEADLCFKLAGGKGKGRGGKK